MFLHHHKWYKMAKHIGCSLNIYINNHIKFFCWNIPRLVILVYRTSIVYCHKESAIRLQGTYMERANKIFDAAMNFKKENFSVDLLVDGLESTFAFEQ
jgi:hypothetical protein